MTKAEQRKLATALKTTVAIAQEMFDDSIAEKPDGKSLSYVVGYLLGVLDNAAFELEHF
jgi:hypothetical protein